MSIQLKSLTENYDALVAGDKKASLRLNDRNYKIGDIVEFREYDPQSDSYSGRSFIAKITDVSNVSKQIGYYPENKDVEISKELVVLSIEII